MLRNQKLPIDEIYVPAKLQRTLDPQVVEEIAESLLKGEAIRPILVRRDATRFVLVDGLHRLEACKALGETSITGLIVQARQT